MVESVRKPKIKKLLATVKSELPPSSAPNAPCEGAIALRAHEIYEVRGRLDGCDVADWLQAEAELRG
jgi:hypothetical protein